MVGYILLLIFYLSEPHLRDVPMQTGESVMDICHVGVSFIGKS